MRLFSKNILLLLFFNLFSLFSLSAQIDWVAATGLNLGDTFIDGAVYNNFGGTGLNVRINVNIVAGNPSIDSVDPTIVFIRDSDGASMTLTFLNGTGDVELRNFENLILTETITVSNPDGKDITVTEISNNGGLPMTVDGIAMPTGSVPNAIVGDDSVILKEQNKGAGTIHDIRMNGVTGFTWLYQATKISREGFKLNLSAIVLPIELITFNATLLQNDNVQLDWTTATETNNDYFTIERSKDGISWEQIAKINGSGSVYSPTSYSYRDEATNHQLSYYRLKQTDFEQQFSYSSVVSINRKKNEAEAVNIYPNPATNLITISGLDINQDVIEIMDISGNAVNNLVVITSFAKAMYQIELSALPTGVYFIRTPNSVNKFFKK